MKILVTGASGYIGNKLVHALANNGNKVHAFILPTDEEKLLQHPNITIFKGNILDKESLSVAIKGSAGLSHGWHGKTMGKECRCFLPVKSGRH